MAMKSNTPRAKPSRPKTASAAAKNKVALAAKGRTKTAAGKTRPAAMKSRGSNTAKQIGDQNQREWYNGIRQKAGGKVVNTSTDANGQMLKVTQKEKDGRVRASSQRAGGRGK